MEELFQILSSSARLNKSKKRGVTNPSTSNDDEHKKSDDSLKNLKLSAVDTDKFDEEKVLQIHREQVAHFRRSLHIRVNNKQDPTIPDPISSFHELKCPTWWNSATDDGAPTAAADSSSFDRIYHSILANVERGKWKDPTAIQMQALTCLVARRDTIGAAPTGSGKSGAFIIPTLLLTKATDAVYYGLVGDRVNNNDLKPKSKKDKSKQQQSRQSSAARSLLIAPSLELASQLHREVERLSQGLPRFRSCLLSKSNAPQVISGQVGGRGGGDGNGGGESDHGLHVLVATPLRLVDCIDKGLQLNRVRIVVLDEADRLLDAADGGAKNKKTIKGGNSNTSSNTTPSGSSHSKTFLSQMDVILSEIPSTAVRALFSATVTPTVRSLAESILRNPVDITIQALSSTHGPGGANPDITQKLVFVGKEQGKLLAIRQLVARGELRPPVLVFTQSQERAQALFEELLYDRIRVDVLHAGRSKAARDNAVAKFRQGTSTWVLICTDLVARGVDFRAVNMVINYDLPESGITYIHRIGRTGRAGRKGTALTFFTEADFDHLRTIANIMKQSGCQVEEWMLNLRKTKRHDQHVQRSRQDIDTTPKYDRVKRRKKQQMMEQSKKKSEREEL